MSDTELQEKFLKACQKDSLPNCDVFSVKCFQGFGFIIIKNVSKENALKISKLLRLEHNGIGFSVKLALKRKMARQNLMKNKEKKLLVTKLKCDVDQAMLQRYFEQYGKLDSCYIAYDPVTQKHKGFGFLFYSDLKDANKVCDIKNFNINGSIAIVKKNLLQNETIAGVDNPDKNCMKACVNQIENLNLNMTSPQENDTRQAYQQSYSYIEYNGFSSNQNCSNVSQEQQ